MVNQDSHQHQSLQLSPTLSPPLTLAQVVRTVLFPSSIAIVTFLNYFSSVFTMIVLCSCFPPV